MERPTQENTLYLPVKQICFDRIVEGAKRTETRGIKEGITANRYLLKGPDGRYVVDSSVADAQKEYCLDDYNGGKFPFPPRPYEYPSLAVGYAEERDTALVETAGFSFEPCSVRKKSVRVLDDCLPFGKGGGMAPDIRA